jgi:hypothetical protein
MNLIINTILKLYRGILIMGVKKYLALFALLSGFASTASADGIIYIGGGSAETASTTVNGDTPMSIGYLALRDEGAFFGFDIGAEGTVLDSTYSQNNKPSQAYSFNLILGTNISKDEKSRLDVGAIVGFREEAKDCPSSYLGYACYANTSPDTEYKANLGAIITYSYNKLAIGLRATDASTQLILGAKF